MPKSPSENSLTPESDKSALEPSIIPNPRLNETNEFQGELAQRTIVREHKRGPQNSLAHLKMGLGITQPANFDPQPNDDLSKPFVNTIGEELMVDLTINYGETQIVSNIIDTGRGILVPIDDLKDFSIRQSYLYDNSLIVEGARYINLKSLERVSYDLNRLELKLAINFPPEAMNKQQLQASISGKDIETHPSTKSKGGFVNYDLVLSRNQGENSASSIQELNYFTPNDTTSHSYFFRKNAGKLTKKDALIRLETAWTKEDEESMAKWKIGDSSTKSSEWSGSTRFGGIQYSTNFAMRPGLITYPLIDYSGTANTPTKIEVFSNSLPIYQTDISTGQFNINDLPINGHGNLVVKATDITGKVQTIQLPYYTSNTLLKKDLADYSFSMGQQRQHYTVESYRYKHYVSSADYMRGITDYWTSGFHGDFKHASNGKNLAVLGLSNVFQLSDYGTISGSVASSLPKIKKAQKMAVNYNYQGKKFDFSTGLSTSGQGFLEPFFYPYKTSNKPRYQSSIGYYGESWGSITTNYTSIAPNETRLHIISTTYSKDLTKNSFLRVTMGRTLNDKKNNFITLSYGLNLGKTSMNSEVSKTSNGYTENIAVSNPIEGKLGWGGRGSFYHEPDYSRYDLQFDKNSSKVDTSVFMFGQDKNNQTQQLNLRGSVIGMDKDIFFTRPVSGGIAVIKSGGFKDVTVYSNNNPVGVTNKSGKLAIPDIIPYVPSEITLDSYQMPFSAQFSTVNSKINVRDKGGEVLDFEVMKVRSLLMNLVDNENKPIELNRLVTLENVIEKTYLGYYGVAYFTDIGDVNVAKGTACNEDNNTCCSFNVEIHENKDDFLINLGEVKCE